MDRELRFRLAGVVRESIVDGPGLRFTVFFQGCPHRCTGCHNQTTLDFDGGRVVVAHVSEETLGQARGLGLILVADSDEVLIGERLAATQARASWTSNPLVVFIAEHHLRTVLYLPQILACLGENALDLIHEEDRDLFSRALESRIEC